jgi:hypothetical protein
MKKRSATLLPVMIAGALLGILFGCLLTWFPIRLLFCAYYNTPDCEEIVLMAFPLYCFITPLLGALIAYLIYRRQHKSQAE